MDITIKMMLWYCAGVIIGLLSIVASLLLGIFPAVMILILQIYPISVWILISGSMMVFILGIIATLGCFDNVKGLENERRTRNKVV